jgi:hypothetical protein
LGGGRANWLSLACRGGEWLVGRRYYKVRPVAGDDNPTRTKAQYCVYDEPHGDYVYTEAWVKHLIKELSDPKTFKKVVGHEPARTQRRVSR